MISMDECERRVEAMEAKAAEMLAEVESLFRISHVLGAFSGGNDSIVSTHWAMEAKPDALVMERFPWDWESGPPKWWTDAKRGQQFLFPPEPHFMPACIGCSRKPQFIQTPISQERT